MIRIDDLSLTYENKTALTHVSLNLNKGVPLAIIGESGAGKSSLAMALMGMSKGVITGVIEVDGFSVTNSKESALCTYRGKEASMVFQHLSDSLNPQRPIIEQVIEPLLAHKLLSRKLSLKKASEMLIQLGIENEKHKFYPYQLSGGQIQRVMLAMAAITNPKLIILDEPTAALDPSSKKHIENQIKAFSKDRYMMIITHDLDVALNVSKETAILYGGAILEKGPSPKVLIHARHPYTRGLNRARPVKEKRKDLQGIPGKYIPSQKGCVFAGRCTQKIAMCSEKQPPMDEIKGHIVYCHRKGIVTLLSVSNLSKSFQIFQWDTPF